MDHIVHRVLRFDRFALDLACGCLRAGAQESGLRSKTFEVLCHLATNAGRLVSKQELFEALWPNVSVCDDLLAQCIRELRQKLGDDDRRLIRTVSRRGYMLDATVSTQVDWDTATRIVLRSENCWMAEQIDLAPTRTVLRRREAEKRSVLQSHYLFGKLAPNHIDRLASCIVEKSIRRGAIIFAKDDPGSCLFAIRKGTAKMTVPSADGHEVVVNLVTKGDIFGEIALLDGRPRTTDAVAISDCEMLVIERRDFLPLVREEPEIALKLIEILCARLRQTTQQVESVMFFHLPARLAKALLRLSGAGGGARERRVAVTQKDLGNIIGMSRESTNRQLRLWVENKRIRLERGVITILSMEALERIAESDSEGPIM